MNLLFEFHDFEFGGSTENYTICNCIVSLCGLCIEFDLIVPFSFRIAFRSVRDTALALVTHQIAEKLVPGQVICDNALFFWSKTCQWFHVI